MPRPRKDPSFIILTQDQIGTFRQNVMSLAEQLLSDAHRVEPKVVSQKRGRPPKQVQQNQSQ